MNEKQYLSMIEQDNALAIVQEVVKVELDIEAQVEFETKVEDGKIKVSKVNEVSFNFTLDDLANDIKKSLNEDLKEQGEKQ